MSKKFAHLFNPITIGNMTVPNRIIIGPNNEGSSHEREAGGAAINTWGCGTIDVPGAGMLGDVPYMFSKYECQKTRRILDFMHQGGSKASLEIMHAGMARRGENTVGPCDGTALYGQPCHGLTEPEMEVIVKAFARMARDARDFGFDMIMLHFAHGWLPAQFLSPAWNKRTDGYGGCYDNRRKFPLAIVKAVREAVGPNYPIDMRISCKEWVKGESIAFEDVVHFIKDCEPYISMVNLSAGTDINKDGCVHMMTSALEPRLVNVNFAKIIKETVSIPVAVVGAVLTPEDAESVIAEGYADLVTLSRAVIADPFWIQKAYEGRSEDIVPCIRCGKCMHWTTDRYNHGCSVNPRYLRGDWVSYTIPKDQDKRRFVIVGGGIAGMRAALTANERGHEVILLEKQAALGGALRFTEHTSHKNDIRAYKDYLIGQIVKSSIMVSLNTEATPELVREMKPDVLIVAVGAKASVPPIKGAEHGMLATESYSRRNEVGRRVVIIGGGTIGCELALELDEQDHAVTIIEAGERLHRQDSLMLDIALDEHLAKCRQLAVKLSAQCREITDAGVVLADGECIDCDTVILATGLKADRSLADSFYGITPKTFIVGDCVRSGQIKEANDQGYFTALNA